MTEDRPKKGVAGGELDLLREIRRIAGRGSARRGVRLGIGDDCALLRPREDEEIAVTTDLSIAGRHFRLDWHPPECVGHRTLARGLSDLAAMGARPLAAFLSLGLPRELTDKQKGKVSWADRFLDGFLALAKACNSPLAGGDLAESPVAVADIVLVGAVPRDKALLRSGARPGDLLYVTGSLGGASAGLAILAENAARIDFSKNGRGGKFGDVLAPHLFPQPRLAQARWLRQRGLATAALDVSDGLSTDLNHLCEESRVAAMVEQDLLPRAPGASLRQALHGGEDYELLFTARPSAKIPRAIDGIRITQIGCITKRRPEDPPMTLKSGRVVGPLDPQGWEHFS